MKTNATPYFRKFIGYVIVYRQLAHLGLDEYLVVEDWRYKAATRAVDLEKATIFSDPESVEKWAELFKWGGSNHHHARIISVFTETRKVEGKEVTPESDDLRPEYDVAALTPVARSRRAAWRRRLSE